MGELLRETDKLLRYVLSGFVALGVLWAVDEKHRVLLDLKTQVCSWWPVLLLAPLIGVLVFTIHRSVHSWFVEPCTQRCACARWCVCTLRGIRRIGDICICSPAGKRLRKRLQRYDEYRWLRRVSSNKKHCSAQSWLDSWGSHIHFLYCSAWATALTLVLSLFLPHLDIDRRWFGIAVVTCAVLFLLGFTSDVRAWKAELIVYKMSKADLDKEVECKLKASPNTDVAGASLATGAADGTISGPAPD